VHSFKLDLAFQSESVLLQREVPDTANSLLKGK